ncbi:MAG: carbohydrate ABC transporter permease [Fusicatenibacter sp.]
MKKKKNIQVFDCVNYLIMIVLCIICVYPLIYVLFASLSDPTLLQAHKGLLFYPLGGGTVSGYKLVMQNQNIISGYGNTIIYVTGSTVFSLFMTVLAAYVVSRRKWMWSGNLAFMITLHMFVGGGLIPFYLLVKELGMINTRWSLIIPGALSVYNMVVLRTSMEGIPDALEESAKIDGANDLVILFKIILPLIKAALAVQVLFYAVNAWNAWFNASIFIRDRSLMPIQIILREIMIDNDMQSMVGIDFSDVTNLARYQVLTKYCVAIIATVPILIIYPILQKYFVKGVMVGSVKG